MKRNDIKSLHTKSRTELEKELDEKNRDLVKMTLEQKVKRVKNTRMLTGLKDDIARIATVLKEFSIKEKQT